MTWTFANAVVQRDGKDNIQPIKKRSRGRIDPVVATCSAISVWKREPKAMASVYDQEGVFVI
jgi:phage terminase large subunit-like protein